MQVEGVSCRSFYKVGELFWNIRKRYYDSMFDKLARLIGYIDKVDVHLDLMYTYI